MAATRKLTEFQIRVLKEISKIPAGETRTYKQIAEALGNPKASRAVGLACNKNPFPYTIPCHRVIGSNGSLTGYAFGLEQKKNILELEKRVNSRV
jgi:O-6-methylguanine DNA methyltransferase